MWSHKREGTDMKTSSVLRRAVAAAGAVTALLALAGPPARPRYRPETTTVSIQHPGSVSMNSSAFRSSSSPVLRGSHGGRTLAAGRRLLRRRGSDAVYPPGYVPLHASPVDDFFAKLTVKVVTDGGTNRRRPTRSPRRTRTRSARMSGSTTSTRRFPTCRGSSSSPAWRRSAPATTPTNSSGCYPPRTATDSALTKPKAASPPARTRPVGSTRGRLDPLACWR